MISACKTASARKVIAVIPCFPYSRQRTFVTNHDSNEHPSSIIQNADSSTSLESMCVLPHVLCGTPEKCVPVQLHGTPDKMFRIETINDMCSSDTQLETHKELESISCESKLDSCIKTMSISIDLPSKSILISFLSDLSEDKRSDFSFSTPTKMSIDNVFKRPSSLPPSVNRPPKSPLTRLEYTG